MARSFDAGQPAVVIDADTGERQLIWAELDSHASVGRRPQPLHPARQELQRGPPLHRRPAQPQARRRLGDRAARAFRVYRDRIVTTSPTVEARRAHMEDLFARLGRAGIGRGDLYLAWDFTVGSGQRIAGRMLGMRDTAFAELGDDDLADRRQGAAPASCAPGRPPGRRGDPRVCGKFTVPCFLDQPGCPPGSRFAFADAEEQRPRPARTATRWPPTTTASCRTDADRRPAPDGALRPRAARRRLRGRPRAAARDGQAPRLHLLRHRLEGDGDGGRPQRRA